MGHHEVLQVFPQGTREVPLTSLASHDMIYSKLYHFLLSLTQEEGAASKPGVERQDLALSLVLRHWAEPKG